ncbi:MAG: hypothetical protein AAFR76_00165 [Planctomycetota bacterium]
MSRAAKRKAGRRVHVGVAAAVVGLAAAGSIGCTCYGGRYHSNSSYGSSYSGAVRSYSGGAEGGIVLGVLALFYIIADACG